jgi:hypothetical protein
MKKIRNAFMIAVLASLLLVIAAFAQTGELTLRLSKDFGYSGFNADIQGTFSMHVNGPADLVRVVFYIDDKTIGEDTTAPFALQFVTDNYPIGVHQMSAVGTSSGGQVYKSNVITQNFISASQGNQATTRIIIPLLGVIVVAILISTLGPLLFNRGKRTSLPLGVERNYGIRGGTICPKCQRPFVLPLFSAHLGFSRVAACPYCGKLSLVRAESIDKLRDAEKAELGQGLADAPKVSEEDKFRKDLEDSKFQGM